jgi:hypothetical protein
MNNIQKLGFDNWFCPLDIPSGKGKVDLSKPSDFKVAKVISVKENRLYFENTLIIKPQCINEKI